MIGAGSTVFARTLISDVVSFADLADGLTVALMDIDADRLRATQRMTEAAGVPVEATLDRRAALAGADYVLTMFQVGGYRPATVTDFDTGAPVGDAMVHIPDLGPPVSPGSTVGGCMLVNAIKAHASPGSEANASKSATVKVSPTRTR